MNQNQNQKPFDILNQESDLDSPDLQAVITYLTENFITPGGLKIGYVKYKTKAKKIYEKAPEIGHVDFFDAGRRYLFNLLNAHQTGPVEGCATLKAVTLNRLFSLIRVENKQFFPLRDMYLRKVLRGDPNLILVPSVTYEKYDRITTACMSSSADLVLNKRFCQNLMNFAYLCETSTKSKKYKSNGGKLPDEYHPIESVIVHEFLHYTHGDFHLGEILGEDNLVVNYATDFRSNYKMVKEGHLPLPMGLYSPYLNYDQQSTMRELVAKVKELLAKLKPEEKKDATDEHYDSYDRPTNNLPDPQNSDDKSDDESANLDGEGEEAEQEGTGNEDGGKKGKSSVDDSLEDGGEGEGEGEGEDGANNSSKEGDNNQEDTEGDESKTGSRNDGSDSKSQNGGALSKTIERVLRRVSEEAVERNEKDIDSKALGESGDDKDDSAATNQHKITGVGNPQKVDLSSDEIRPAFNWKRLLNRAVQTATDETEESYAKLSRSMGTRLQTALHTGLAVIKPGDVAKPKTKLVFVIDSSYSMHAVVKRVYIELKKLLDTADVDPEILLFNFSDHYEVHLCNTKRGVAYRLNNKDLKRTNAQPITIKDAMRTHFEGTTLQTEMVTTLSRLAKAGNCIVLATDTDVFWGSNVDLMTRLVRECKQNLYIIFDDARSYEIATLTLKSSSRNFTYWQ